MRGVHAFDVESRIGFGVPLLLRGLKHLVEVGARALHLRQYVITGAVENAVDTVERVGGSTFAQSLHDRDTASHRSFESEGRLLDRGEFGQLEPVMGHHRLVRSDQALACIERGAGERERGAVGAADQFDNDIDIRAGRHGLHVVDPGVPGKVDAPVLAPLASSHRDDLYRPAGAGSDHVAVGFDQADHSGADSAETGQRYAQGIRHRRPPVPGNRKPRAPRRAQE